MEVSAELVKRVNQLMHEGFEIPLEKLVPEAKLYEDLALDSLDAVDMLVHLEDSLKVKVAGEKFMHVRTLSDIHRVVQEVVLENEASIPELNLNPHPEVG